MKDEDTRKLGDLCNLFVEYREEVKKQEIQNFDYFLHGKTQFQEQAFLNRGFQRESL